MMVPNLAHCAVVENTFYNLQGVVFRNTNTAILDYLVVLLFLPDCSFQQVLNSQFVLSNYLFLASTVVFHEHVRGRTFAWNKQVA